MTAAASLGIRPGSLQIATTPPARGRQWTREGGYLSASRLATDSVGNFTLTLTNVVVGSAIRIELQSDGSTVDSTTAASSTVVMTIPAYAAGSDGNNLKVKIRKGSASPYYRPYETLVTGFVGAQSIYVSQIADE